MVLDLISTTVSTLNTAFDIGKTVGSWIFGTGKSGKPGPLPAWAAQGTPAYGEWSYTGVPAKRLVYIDRITGGHRVFGPSQAASLLLADMPPLPKGSLVTLDPEAGKTGVLNPAAVKRALQGCPSAPQQSDATPPPAPAPVVPPAVAPAPASPRLEQFFSDLALSAVPRAAVQLAPFFGDLTRPVGSLRLNPTLPSRPREWWEPAPPQWPSMGPEDWRQRDLWQAPQGPPSGLPEDQGGWNDTLAPPQSDVPQPAPAPSACGCVMPCCPGGSARPAPRRQRAKPRLRPNVTIICGGRKRKL